MVRRSSICPADRTVTHTCSPTSSPWGCENRSHWTRACGDGPVSGGARVILQSLGPWKKPFLVHGTCLLFFSLWLLWPLGVTVHAPPSRKSTHVYVGDTCECVQLCVCRRAGAGCVLFLEPGLPRAGRRPLHPAPPRLFSVSLHANLPEALLQARGHFRCFACVMGLQGTSVTVLPV